MKSKVKLRINVSPSGDTTHKLTHTRVAASDLKITRTQTEGADTPNNEGDDRFTFSGGNVSGTPGQLEFTVYIRLLNSDGTTPIDTSITSTDGLSVRAQGDDGVIATLPTTTTGITIESGIVTITIAADGWGKPGSTRLIVSYDTGANYAEEEGLPLITVVDAE